MDRDEQRAVRAQRRAPRLLVGARLAVVAALALAGCGAGTVDRQEEARALVATCRSIQERSTGRPAVPVDATEIEELLAAEPGAAGDRSVASLVRRVCAAASRAASDGPAPWLPLPFPERPGR